MKKNVIITGFLLMLIIFTQADALGQTMVKSSKGIDFLYEIYDGVGGGYKVKLIIANNTGNDVVTSGDFRLDFVAGGWIKMGPSTIKAYDEKQYVWDGNYKNYPNVKSWNTPGFTFK